MKKIIVFLVILIVTILFTSCSTQQRVVYRDCDCNTTTFGLGLGWNNNPYWGWNDPFWRWNNSMLWGWSGYPYRMLPRYYIQPNRVQPSQPTRYERRRSIGNRPSRNTQNWSNDTDPMYLRRTPSVPRIEAKPSQRTTHPSRIQSTPNRNYQPSQRTTQPQQRSTPSRTQSPVYRSTPPTTRSRSGNN